MTIRTKSGFVLFKNIAKGTNHRIGTFIFTHNSHVQIARQYISQDKKTCAIGNGSLIVSSNWKISYIPVQHA